MVKVMIQEIRATRRTEARAFCRPHRISLPGSSTSLICADVQEPVISDNASNAKLKLAESNTMKTRSRNISLILAFAGLSPKGFPVYSSYVIQTRYTKATASTLIAITVDGP